MSLPRTIDRYRETLKDEQKTACKIADVDQRTGLPGGRFHARLAELKGQVAAIEANQGQVKQNPRDAERARYLYDNGRNESTPFNPKGRTDTFYTRPDAGSGKDLFRGDMRFHSSSAMGYNDSAYKTIDFKAGFGHRHATDEFNDHGHLSL